MIYAAISVLIGILPIVSPIPVVVPVIGLALGANGYLRERKKDPVAQQKRVMVISALGILVCSLWVILALGNQFLGGR